MKKRGLYLQLISIHGLIRGNMPELGKDADTGGQVKYVLELAKSLGHQHDVARVDLLTRLIEDKNVSSAYSKPFEELSDNVRIIRIQCGGKKYIRKELLWPFLEEFIDKTIRFITAQHQTPDLFHGHYADAGYVAMELATAFDRPFLFTGHSLGKPKQEKLLAEGFTSSQIDKQYKIIQRIQTEEEVIARSNHIITSTQQEIDKQYGMYSNKDQGTFSVIAPGIDLETFYPFYDRQFDSECIDETTKQTRYTLKNELHRFWTYPYKPFVLALCRPDHRKNISGLLQTYGTNKELQALANLAIFAGIRNDISTMGENEKEVLTEMLLLMDRYDLYGKLAIPKKHNFSTEVPELYRICAESKGIFINPALTEPFGITLIEASSCGLPVVATNDGGPRDILANCNNGILIDSTNSEDMGKALLSILVDDKTWQNYSNNGINGVRTHYSWHTHSEKCLALIHRTIPHSADFSSTDKSQVTCKNKKSFGSRLAAVKSLLITDIDNTLLGNNESMEELFELLKIHRDTLAWGVATGRSISLTLEAMTEYNIPMPDILISSVGTEIYYGPDLRFDKGWQQHISWQWKPEQIKKVLADFAFVIFQEAEGQRSHKISYYMEDTDEHLTKIKKRLQEERIKCNIIYSHGQFLDILPARASKGKAIDYIRYKFLFPVRNVMVAGDSGNDEDMLAGHTRGLIVGNHCKELDVLKGKPNVFFSQYNFAAGIIEGLHIFGIL